MHTTTTTTSITLWTCCIAAFALASCAGSDAQQDLRATGKALFTEPCSSASCGEAPAGEGACAPSEGRCVWTDSPDTPVSYSPCDDAQCGKAPGAEVCAEGTEFKGNQCGSENAGPCRWTTTCAPPRSTVACPRADGCGPMQLIGVICKDGSNGSLACMKQKDGCGWERTCD